MTKNHPLALAALALVLTSTDCKSGEVGLAPDTLSAQLAKAFCERRLGCCAPSELVEASEGRYTTLEECLEFAQLATDTQMASLSNEIDAGRITIDVAVAKTCVEGYAASACNTSLLQPETITPLPDVAQIIAGCPGLLEGHVPTGSRCELPQQCEAGSRCVFPAPAYPSGLGGADGVSGGGLVGGSNSGICIAVRALGETCNSTADCDPTGNLYCRRPQFVCSPPASNGEPCVLGFSEEETIPCAAGSVCDPLRRRCARAPRAGEPCAFDGTCDPDPTFALSCNSFTSLCVSPGGPGAACGGAALAPCRADLACVDLQRDGIGVCGPPPTLGQPCTDKCVAPAICNLANFPATCQMPGNTPPGAPCSSHEQCANLHCESQGTPGAVCLPSRQPPICDGSGVTSASRGGFAGTFGGVGMGGAGGGTVGGGGTIGTGGIAGGSGGVSGTAGVGNAGGATGPAGATGGST